MSDLMVDPGGLRAVSAGITGAAGAFESATAALESADALLQSGLRFDQDGRADDKIHTFTRQFRREFELMSHMLQGFHSLLEQAADAYEAQESTIIAACCPREG